MDNKPKQLGGRRPGAGRKSLSEEYAEFEKIRKHTKKAIKFLGFALDSNDNELKKWATKIVLDKIVPDKKATELTGANGGGIIIQLASEMLYPPQDANERLNTVPEPGRLIAAPTGSTDK